MRNLWIALTVVSAIGLITVQYNAYSPEFSPPPEQCGPSTIESPDYSIYRYFLGQYAPEHRSDWGTAILISETEPVSNPYLSNSDISIGNVITKMAASSKDVTLSQNTVSNFLQVSTDVAPLNREQFDELQIMLSDEAELDELLEKRGGWGELYSPEGVSKVVRFSRIGFSCDGNQALMYRSEFCGPTCGHGLLQVIEKSGNYWPVVLSRTVWASCPEPNCGRKLPSDEEKSRAMYSNEKEQIKAVHEAFTYLDSVGVYVELHQTIMPHFPHTDYVDCRMKANSRFDTKLDRAKAEAMCFLRHQPNWITERPSTNPE